MNHYKVKLLRHKLQYYKQIANQKIIYIYFLFHDKK